jgi:serine phosphatase RsbU (regulator of sigma subunit)
VTRRTRPVVAYALAVVLPILVAYVFPHPARRVLLPATLMFAVVVLVTLIAGLLPGIVAATASVAGLWFFSVPPGETFAIDRTEDGVMLALVFVVFVGITLVIARLRARDAEAARVRARNEFALATQADMVAKLQDALLPHMRPMVEGARIASHYVVGGGQSSPVGGDWYAFVPLARDRLGIAIGDAVGHGVDAVAAMAEYRYSLRVVAVDGCDPATALSRLETAIGVFGGTRLATGVYGVIDTGALTWTFANAGHLPPLLVHGNGAVDLLETNAAPLLTGGLGDGVYENTVVGLRADDLLVLYTDGLVERRGEHLDKGIDRLANHLSATRDGDLASTLASTVHEFVGDEPEDDVAIVAVRLDARGTRA